MRCAALYCIAFVAVSFVSKRCCNGIEIRGRDFGRQFLRVREREREGGRKAKACLETLLFV